MILDYVKTVGHAVVGAGVTGLAGIVGAGAGAAVAPDSLIGVMVGLVAAVAAAMAWVDRRIERRLVDHDAVYNAKAETRDANLLRKVEEMLR